MKEVINMSNPKVEVLPIEKGATTDLNNVNKHTQRGEALVENSLRKRGAFRSVASAGKGVKIPVVYAGNLTLEKAVEAGFKEVVNVHVTGDQLVNVVRDDIEPGSQEAVALGLEDNESAKQSYNPDIDVLAALTAGDSALLANLQKEDKVFGHMLSGMVGGMAGYVRPGFDDIIEKFEEPDGVRGKSKADGNWFYVEIYGNDDLFAELGDILKEGLASDHQIKPEFFEKIVRSYAEHAGDG